MGINRLSLALLSIGLGFLASGASVAWLLGMSNLTAQLSIIGGVLLVLAALFREKEQAEAFLKSRSFSYGSGSSLLVLSLSPC